MTPEIQNAVNRYTKLFNCGKTLEIGSANINGSVRQFFDTRDYLGIDMSPGPGVDLVLNSHELREFFAPSEFDTVVWLESAEHDSAFWITLDGINNILKTGGHLIVSTPSINFHYHSYPRDYWRFTKDSYEDVFFKGYEILALEEVRDTIGQIGIIGMGRKL